MNKNLHWKSFLAGSFIAAAVIIGVAAQSNDQAAPERVGRYQVVAATGQAFVIDSVTGEVWGHYDPHFKSAKLRAQKK